MRSFKFYVIGLLILGVNARLSAQEDKKVALAFTVSPSVAWLSPTNTGYESDGNKIGFKYGLLMDFRLFGVDNYSLTSGFTMNHIGGKIIEPSTFETSTGTVVSAKDAANYKMTYIDVPFAIRLKTNEIGYNTFYAVFGSEMGFNITAKKDVTTTYGSTTTGEITQDVGGDINLFRTSLVIGLGVERNISGNTNYRIGVTYHNGLTNIMDGDAYKVDANGETMISGNAGVMDKSNNTKLKFVELNLAIIF